MVVTLLSAPPVTGLSFLARFLAHLTLWTLCFFTIQFVVDLGVAISSWTGAAKRSARAPQLSRWRFVWENACTHRDYAFALALAAAWLNPGGGWSWNYACPAPVLLVYFSLATLMAYDAWSYFWHRYNHTNKTLFNLVHAKHHDQKAALDTRSGGYATFLDTLGGASLPLMCIYALGVATGNWWFAFAGIWNAVFIVYAGHSGMEFTLTDARGAAMLIFNPMAVGLFGTPVHAEATAHEEHHMYPRKNYAFYFTYWDERYGTSTRTGPPTTLLILVAHGVYQLIFLSNIHAIYSYPTAWATAWLLLYGLIPPAAAAAVAQAIKLPEATRKLFGWYMDLYRRDSAVTYLPQGAPGAFSPSAGLTAPQVITANAKARRSSSRNSRTPAADAATTTSSSAASSKPPVYLFAVHPTGLFSRGAFLTFGARGWSSPVSCLPAVRFVVPTWLMYIPLPFLREFLLCCGCIPSDWSTLKHALQSGASLAINPGGWAETQHLQTYNLVLQKRRGFVALAATTGAHLVPVLALGEQEVVGPVEPGYQFMKFATSRRPHPVSMVFGQPLVPGPDESVSQLHTRYTQALLALGKEHGVKLNIVE